MKKAFIIGLAAVSLVFLAMFLLFFTDVFLAFFNVALGNEVYALTISYTVNSTPDFAFSLCKTRIPVESILSSYKVKEVGEAEANGNITLNVLVWVLNRQKLFQATFTFNDAKPRQITVFLSKLQLQHEIVTVEVTGTYNNAPLTAGTQLKIGEANGQI